MDMYRRVSSGLAAIALGFLLVNCGDSAPEEPGSAIEEETEAQENNDESSKNNENEESDGSNVVNNPDFPEPEAAYIRAPESLEFQAGEGESTGVMLEIHSDGALVLEISEFEVEGDNFSLAELPQDLPIDLPGGQSLGVEILFSPTTGEESSGVLRVHSNAAGASVLEIELRGNPSCGNLEPGGALMFGDVRIGEDKTESVVFTNCSENAEIVVSEVEISHGPERFHFGFAPAEQPDFPVVVGPQETFTFPITFSPELEGEHAGYVDIKTNSTAGNGSPGEFSTRVAGDGILP